MGNGAKHLHDNEDKQEVRDELDDGAHKMRRVDRPVDRDSIDKIPESVAQGNQPPGKKADTNDSIDNGIAVIQKIDSYSGNGVVTFLPVSICTGERAMFHRCRYLAVYVTGVARII